MLDRFYSRVARLSSLWTIGLYLVLFIIAQSVINGRPLGVVQLHEMTDGVGILDLERGYSPERAYEILTAQGDTGRAFYLRSVIPLDFVFPLTYTLFYLTANTYILQRLFPEKRVIAADADETIHTMGSWHCLTHELPDRL